MSHEVRLPGLQAAEHRLHKANRYGTASQAQRAPARLDSQKVGFFLGKKTHDDRMQHHQIIDPDCPWKIDPLSSTLWYTYKKLEKITMFYG